MEVQSAAGRRGHRQPDALATGEANILVGGGEWVTAVLAAENPALDFSIP